LNCEEESILEEWVSWGSGASEARASERWTWGWLKSKDESAFDNSALGESTLEESTSRASHQPPHPSVLTLRPASTKRGGGAWCPSCYWWPHRSHDYHRDLELCLYGHGDSSQVTKQPPVVFGWRLFDLEIDFSCKTFILHSTSKYLK
jgi:hypothetical protein